MKILITTATTILITGMCLAQPELTLWITPDGYHGDHDHSASQQYFCDGSYYIFYHPDTDTLFVTAKNEGTAPLMLSSASALGLHGAQFEVVDFSQQTLQPGEMYTINLLYQLPPEYVNGFNGMVTIASNDPVNPVCALHFDIGCAAEWEIRTNTTMGVYGNCDEPVVYLKEFQGLVNPNMLYNDTMTFYASYGVDTAGKIMQLSDYGVVMRKDAIAYDRFYAGLTGNGSENAFNVSPIGVNVNQYMQVFAKLRVDDILDADNGISCAGGLYVTGITNLDGDLEVTNNASIQGTLEVDAMTTPSDLRLKRDVDPLVSVVDEMMRLRPKTYYLREDQASSMRQYGFIAQELEEVIPSLVHSNNDGVKSVNYLQIIPWLTAALQEQQETIARLEARLAALEGN